MFAYKVSVQQHVCVCDGLIVLRLGYRYVQATDWSLLTI